MTKTIRHLTTIALLLALFVVMLGAFTRLTDAGLGCPDWPGCYGHMVVPKTSAFPIEQQKAWTEMAHRYCAGSLGLLIVLIFVTSFTQKMRKGAFPVLAPTILVALLIFQALLGMWTVTLKLLPVVVMGHLLGGILILGSLCFFRWQISEIKPVSLPQFYYWVLLGTVIVFLQIALGGWVSSNYAGIACIGFPQCNGSWLPTLHFSQGFNLFSPVGENYQGGLLDHSIRVTIQFIHRLGALITAVYILFLSFWIIMRCQNRIIRTICGLAAFVVLVQFSLGVLNVIYLLPLDVAVAHNGGAAILFATMMSLLYLTRGEAKHAR